MVNVIFRRYPSFRLPALVRKRNISYFMFLSNRSEAGFPFALVPYRAPILIFGVLNVVTNSTRRF